MATELKFIITAANLQAHGTKIKEMAMENI